MTFNLNVTLTEDDYLDYNTFWQFKSPYGKKQILFPRIIIGLIFCLLAFFTIILDNFSTSSIIKAAFYLVALILFQIFFTWLMHWLIKRTIKKLKKNGKMAYEPFATMAFTNNTIMHITPASKSSISYSLIEHVSIIPRKVIYIHINNLTSYILPFSCFTSEEQYSYFVTFIKTKCKKVKYYKQ